MHVHIATAGVGEYVQCTALRIVVAQIDPKDQASFRKQLRDFVDMPLDHGAGEERAQPSAYHAAHNSARDGGRRCRAKTNRGDSCTGSTADVAWNADRGRRALHPRVSFHEGTLRDVMIVLELSDSPIEMTDSVLDRSLGRKDGKRAAIKA